VFLVSLLYFWGSKNICKPPLPPHFACSVTVCPQNSAPAISLSQKWWPRVLCLKVARCQWEGWAGTYRDPIFSFWGGGAVRLFFPVVVNAFPMCSHHFPVGSLSGSQRVLQIPRLFPKTFLTAPQICPIYELKRWMSGGPHLFLVCNCAQRGASVGECPLFQNKLVMGQSKWLSLKTHKQKKKIKGVRPPLNYNEENIGKRVDDGRFFSISCSLPKVLLLYCT
jgi:hypothetical protein